MSVMQKYAFRVCAHHHDVVRNKTTVSGPCHICATPLSVEVETEAFEHFRAGEFADRCCPYLSAGQREFLSSGICDACWDSVFGGEEDEDE